jgi:hypothetical protein
MFIQSLSYSPLEASYGIKLSFNDINPADKKIADIISASRSNRISNIGLSSAARPVASGESFKIKSSTIPNSTVPAIDNSFLGTFKPSTVTYTNGQGSLTFYQESASDINTISVVGDLYSIANIKPREFYLVQFSIESIVPESAQIILSPSSYVIGGAESFSPVTVVQIKSLYSKTSKALIKMLIKDINTNTVLKTEYIQLIVSDSSAAPCEIISQDPVDQSYIYLDIDNNWKYDYQGYRLAEFIPPNEDTVVKLTKKNVRLLPNRLDANRIKIVIDPIKTANYSISIDQIRSAILSQYATIQNSFALANLGNKSYDIVVSDVLLKPEDLNNLVIAKYPPVTGLDIKFSDVAKSEPYAPDIAGIPEVNLLRYYNDNNITYLGEIHFDNTIYLDSPVVVDYNGVSFSGNLQTATQGPNYLTEI